MSFWHNKSKWVRETQRPRPAPVVNRDHWAKVLQGGQRWSKLKVYDLKEWAYPPWTLSLVQMKELPDQLSLKFDGHTRTQTDRCTKLKQICIQSVDPQCGTKYYRDNNIF